MAAIAQGRAAPAAGIALRSAGLVALAGLLLFAITVGVAVGARALAPGVVWHALWHPDGDRDAIIVWQLRLPRTLVGALVGAALGVAGALIQALTRNPLADPGLLGVNAGAAFAVVLGITLFGADGLSDYVGLALIGALAAAGGVFALDRIAPAGRREVHLVLTGAAVSALIRACTGILALSNSATFDTCRFWVLGSLNRPVPSGLWAIGTAMTLAMMLAMPLGGRLNTMALGDDLVRSLGVGVFRMRAVSFVGVVVLCGCGTAIAGPISFVGLVVPHLARLALGPDWRWILPYSALTGATLLIVSDVVGRVAAPPGELEAGIVTAFIGAPLLLWLVTQRHGAGR
jgi:iron complex transport system permease protein